MVFAICIALAMVFAPAEMFAQVGAADVLGTVTDPSGAVVQNAKVTVKDLGTSATRTAATNERGDYIFNLLPNGQYYIKVEATGFKTYEVPSFALSAGERLRMDAKLETGNVTEKVEVTATNAALQTDSSTVGSSVEEKAIQDLPISGRNLAKAIQLQAGVQGGVSSGGGVGATPDDSEGRQDRRPSFIVIANGQSAYLNDELIDGFDNNERLMGFTAVRPSLDGIAETRIDTNSYSAEFGRSAGAVVDIITKAGTNEMHGSAFEFLGNDVFNGENYFAASKPEYRLNQFGGSFGGPIKKNKTFIFADIEEDRTIQGITFVATVPTAYERKYPGDLSDLFPAVHAGPPNCGAPNGPPMDQPPCNQPLNVSGMLDTTALKFFNLYPLPNSPDTTATANNYFSSPNKTQYAMTIDGRLDHHFSANDLFFARYAYNPANTVFPGSLPQDPTTKLWPGGALPGDQSTTTAQNLQLDYVHIFSPQLLLDLKSAYTRVHIATVPSNYGKGAAATLGMANVFIPGMPTTDVMPSMAIFSWDVLGDEASDPVLNTNNSFQYSGSVTYTRGPHTLKFGAGFTRRQVNTLENEEGGGAFVFVGGPPFFVDKADFLTGNPMLMNRSNQLYPQGFRASEIGFYVQDDWRLNHKLTLNLGVRYDLFTPITEAHGLYANFDPTTLSLSSTPGPQNFILGSKDPSIGVKTNYDNIAPRVGFAYSITPKTVLRGAYGMSYYPPDVGQSARTSAAVTASVVGNANPPYTFSYFNILAPPPPAPNAPPPPPGPTQNEVFDAGMIPPTTVDLNTYAGNPNVTALSYKAKDIRSSYVEQMNLFLQQQFGGNTISLGYVGVLGRRLLRTVNADQPEVSGSSVTPPNVYQAELPFVTTITYNYNGSSSNYDAMQLIWERRFANGLSVNANYTWSHGLTNVGSTDTYNPSLDYGNSDNDLRQRVATSVNYELPFGSHAAGLLGAAIKGWQANGVYYWQTGLPYTVTNQATASNGYLYDNLSTAVSERPNVIASPKVSHPSVNEWFNPSAFTQQPEGTYGDERVNQLLGPRDRRADLSLMKTFALWERLNLQFRAECFNISNTPNFAAPNAVISDWSSEAPGSQPLWGPKSGTNLGTITQTVASELPRQFQFALKLQF
jgi:outer membrane receptor protein involved in Fe transport